MAQTFGQRLKSFSQAVDIIEEKKVERVFRTVVKYVQNSIGVTFCEMLVAARVEDGPGLRTLFCHGGEDWNKPILRRDGKSYNGHVSFAFDVNKRLWFVSKKGCSLDECPGAALENHWEDPGEGWQSKVPRYKNLTTGVAKIQTSVLVPFWDAPGNRRPIGLFNFELPKRLTPKGSRLKDEFVSISEAMANLHLLACEHERRNDGTECVLEELDAAAREEDPSIVQPTAFFGWPRRGSADVVDAVKKLLKNSYSWLQLYSWDEDAKSGNINLQLESQIARSAVGIFYLSDEEPAEKAEGRRFTDNPNVLIEYGMFKALQKEHRQPRWILLRESQSSSKPFNIQGERMVELRRDRAGRLDARWEAALAEALRVTLGETEFHDGPAAAPPAGQPSSRRAPGGRHGVRR